MSGDLLKDAGVAAGVDLATIEVMREYLRSRNAYVTEDYAKRFRLEADLRKAEARAAADASPDYHGGITRCQAQTAQSGRVTIFDRCERKPKKVRRVNERHGSYKGDGRLAVCLQHARSRYAPSRWVNTDHWTDRGKVRTADEVVEPEYQP